MSTYLTQVWAIVWKDLVLEIRSRERIAAMGAFVKVRADQTRADQVAEVRDLLTNPTLALAKLEQQQARIQKQITLEKRRLASQQRKDDTRRKILDGALVQAEATNNPELAKLLDQRCGNLSHYVLVPMARPADPALRP